MPVIRRCISSSRRTIPAYDQWGLLPSVNRRLGRRWRPPELSLAGRVERGSTATLNQRVIAVAPGELKVCSHLGDQIRPSVRQLVAHAYPAGMPRCRGCPPQRGSTFPDWIVSNRALRLQHEPLVHPGQCHRLTTIASPGPGVNAFLDSVSPHAGD